MDSLRPSCCKFVLPLVFDESLSYYEQLCKIIEYLNSILQGVNLNTEEIEDIKKQIEKIQYILNNFDREYIEKLVEKYIATMIFVEISKSGYIIYHIPESWNDIIFQTVGLDVDIPNIEFGTLVLNY